VSPDAFRRFCLLALCTAYVVALGALALYVSAILAGVGAVFGGLLALTMTIEPTSPASSGTET